PRGGPPGTRAETAQGAEGRSGRRGLGGGGVPTRRFEADGIEAAKVSVFTVPDFDPKAVTPTTAEKAMSRFLPDYRPAVYGPTFTHAAHPCHVITGTVTDATTARPGAGVTSLGTAGPTHAGNQRACSNSVEAA